MFDKLDPTLRGMLSENDGLHETARLNIGLRLPLEITVGALEDKMIELAGDAQLKFDTETPAYRVDKNNALVRAFLAELHRQGQSRASASRKLSALRTFMRYLKREGWIETDPASLAVSPKREQRVPAHLSVDEMSRRNRASGICSKRWATGPGTARSASVTKRPPGSARPATRKRPPRRPISSSAATMLAALPP